MIQSPASLPRLVESWTGITTIDRLRSVIDFLSGRFPGAMCQSDMDHGITLRLWDNQDGTWLVEVTP